MDAALITAWATVGLIGATLIVGGATCLLIWRGIKAMDRSSIERAQDRREAREADLRRHKEAMDEGQRRHEEAMVQHDATLEALRALIERTAPPAATRGQGAD